MPDALTDRIIEEWARDGSLPRYEDVPDDRHADIIPLTLALLREELLMDLAAKEAFEMPEILGMPTGYENVTVQCDRCKQMVEGMESPNLTAGFYRVRDDGDNVSSFANYCDPDEKIICDRCMHSDPRYIAVYGTQQIIA